MIADQGCVEAHYEIGEELDKEAHGAPIDGHYLPQGEYWELFITYLAQQGCSDIINLFEVNLRMIFLRLKSYLKLLLNSSPLFLLLSHYLVYLLLLNSFKLVFMKFNFAFSSIEI